jgi:hypothetical protein
LQTSSKKGKGDEKEDKIQPANQKKASKRKAAKVDEVLGQPLEKKQKISPYTLPKDVQKLIAKDTANCKAWTTVQDSLKLGYPVSLLLFCAV